MTFLLSSPMSVRTLTSASKFTSSCSSCTITNRYFISFNSFECVNALSIDDIIMHDAVVFASASAFHRWLSAIIVFTFGKSTEQWYCQCNSLFGFWHNISTLVPSSAPLHTALRKATIWNVLPKPLSSLRKHDLFWNDVIRNNWYQVPKSKIASPALTFL